MDQAKQQANKTEDTQKTVETRKRRSAGQLERERQKRIQEEEAARLRKLEADRKRESRARARRLADERNESIPA